MAYAHERGEVCHECNIEKLAMGISGNNEQMQF
jgi:hypothetical protein